MSVSMSIYQTLFCFICAHLTSGEKETDAVKRNADVHEIHKRTRFHGVSTSKRIECHDRIIWLGDLNYRLNLSYEKTRDLISKNDWASLLECDQVDLLRRHSFPVYWNGDNRRVLRGHWFAHKGSLDWFPLREDVAEQLEFAYRSRAWHHRTFQPSGLFAARVDMQGSTPGLHAIFTGEDDTWDAWLNIPSSGFSGIVHFGGTGIKLRRGYAPSQSPKPTQDELRQQKKEERLEAKW